MRSGFVFRPEKDKERTAWMCEDRFDFAYRIRDKRVNPYAMFVVPVFVRRRKALQMH